MKFGRQYFFFSFIVAVNNREGSIQVFLLVGYEVDDWIRVLERTNQYFCEEEDSVCQDVLVFTYEDHFLLKGHEG